MTKIVLILLLLSASALLCAGESALRTGNEKLKGLGLKKGLSIVSCPTCGRTEIDLISLTRQVEEKLKKYQDREMTVAVMGCIVNGPGEAREADFGIAGGKKEGLLFRKGEIIKKVSEEQLSEELLILIDEYITGTK
jgi:(E)-4-hydroxy-3-methylbut-2-enyl-diphosphate synthase